MYYFIGIKGAGMSALAVILKKMGHIVAGSDIDKHFFTEEELDIIKRGRNYKRSSHPKHTDIITYKLSEIN